MRDWIRRMVGAMWVAGVALVLLPVVAAAQETAGDGASFLASIPYGVEIAALVVAIAALVTAIIPTDKWPSWAQPIAKVIQWLALNVGQAKNAKQPPDAG